MYNPHKHTYANMLFFTDEVVRYSITGGNRDGLFTIDQNTGVITLAAGLDYEMHDKVS